MPTQRRVVGVVFILAALVLSGTIAQSASAVAKKAYTCSEGAPVKQWSDAHCKDTSGTKKYGHLAFAKNTRTEKRWRLGTLFGNWKLKATINGIATELVATEITGEGFLENVEEGGEEFSTGESTTTLSGISVAKPSGKGCKIYTDNGGTKGEEGVIHTEPLLESTKGLANGEKFSPASGSVIGRFIIDGCEGSEALKGLNKTYEITGSMIGEPNGGETVFTHTATTSQGTLKINGSIAAGIEAAFTRQGRDNNLEDYKALVMT
jgi:hypothetical protein